MLKKDSAAPAGELSAGQAPVAWEEQGLRRCLAVDNVSCGDRRGATGEGRSSHRRQTATRSYAHRAEGSTLHRAVRGIQKEWESMKCERDVEGESKTTYSVAHLKKTQKACIN